MLKGLGSRVSVRIYGLPSVPLDGAQRVEVVAQCSLGQLSVVGYQLVLRRAG